MIVMMIAITPSLNASSGLTKRFVPVFQSPSAGNAVRDAGSIFMGSFSGTPGKGAG
jgi:hypothetical protein